MADIGSTIKNIWMKGMEAIGNTATSIANNTKYKVDEMNMVNRRAEILADFGSKAYALWQKGEKFPEELEAQLYELRELDEKLNDMRAERYAGVKTEQPDSTEEETEEGASREETPEAEDSEEETTAEDTVKEPLTEEEVSEEAEESVTSEDAAETEETAEETGEPETEEGVPVIKVENPAKEAEEKSSVPLSDAINDLFENMPSREEMEDKVNSALDSFGQSLQKFSKEIDEGLNSLTDKMNNDKE